MLAINRKQKSIDTGEGGLTLVLVHGLCCRPKDWEGQVHAFANHCRVIAPLLRGHSDDGLLSKDLGIDQHAKDIAELLIEKGITDAILCGHSLGTRVVLELSALIPDRVRGIILIDGSHGVPSTLQESLNAFDSVTEGSHITGWVQTLFDQMFLQGTHLEKQTEYIQRVSDTSPDTLRALYRNMIFWDGTSFEDRLYRAKNLPILVLQSTIRSTANTRRPLAEGETGPYPDSIVSHHPSVQVITYPNCGHFIDLDAPDKLHHDILGWMTTQGFVLSETPAPQGKTVDV